VRNCSLLIDNQISNEVVVMIKVNHIVLLNARPDEFWDPYKMKFDLLMLATIHRKLHVFFLGLERTIGDF